MSKKNQIVDFRIKSVDELITLGEAKRAELFALKFQAAVGSLEKTHQITIIKKEIARIELVLGEKRIAGENTNKTIKANYSEAVSEAEKSGKAIREKQRKIIEDMQTEQFGEIDSDAMATAMAAGDTETEGENK